MFPSRCGLFKTIPCPSYESKGKCGLPHCIFAHDKRKSSEPQPKRSLPTPNDPPQKVPKLASVSKEKLIKPRSSTGSTPVPKDVPLTPQLLANPPASHQTRLQLLKVVRDKLQENGTPAGECSQTAINLEQETAERSNTHSYKMNMRNLVRAILRGDYKPGALQKKAEQEYKSTKQKLDEELINLLVPLDKLKKRYIMEIPSPPEESISELTFSCERCKTRVTIGDIQRDMEAGVEKCRFHLLRRVWNPEIKSLDHTFPCCGAPRDETQGCEVRNTHVFKLTEPSLLHSVRPFVNTPEGAGLFAAGIDCEMAYTTRGMELIRVTVVSWDNNSVLFDRIVKPAGTVLDLNTRFSGVSDLDAGIDVNGKHYPPQSFEETRKELFELISAKTILIGHGLENDLNTMRLIHERVVDTAILYPRHATRTHSLKQLTWMFLSKTIQTGEHDSSEDSRAAMDIVKADIAQRLKLSLAYVNQ